MSKSSDLYQVESLVDRKVESGKEFFRVHWLGYSSKDDTWEPVENLTNCQDLRKAFMDKAAEERRKSLRSRDSTSRSTPLFSSDEEDTSGPKKSKRVKKTSPSKKAAQCPVTPTKKTTRASVTPTKKATLEDSARKYNLRIRSAEYSSEDESVLDNSRTTKTTRMTLTESKFKKQLNDIKKGNYSLSPHKTSTPQKTSPKPVEKASSSKVQATKKLLFDSSTSRQRLRVSNGPPTRHSQRLIEKSLVAEAPSSIAEDMSVVAQADDDEDHPNFNKENQKKADDLDEFFKNKKKKTEEEQCFPVTWMEFALAAFVTGVAAVGYICYTTDYCGYC